MCSCHWRSQCRRRENNMKRSERSVVGVDQHNDTEGETDDDGTTSAKKVNRLGYVRPRSYNSKFSERYKGDTSRKNLVLPQQPDQTVVQVNPVSDDMNTTCTSASNQNILQDSTECCAASHITEQSTGETSEEDQLSNIIDSPSPETTDIMQSTDNMAYIIEDDIHNLINNHRVEDVIDMESTDYIEPHAQIDEDEDTCTFDWFNQLDFETEDILSNTDMQTDETLAPKETNDEDLIYPGHYLTVKMSVLLIWMYVINHCSTVAQLTDTLTLIGLHCLVPHPALKSVYMFKRYFANMKSPLIKHFYCSYCMTNVEQGADVCTNTFCQKNLSKKSSKSYFIEVPVEAQMKNLFKRNTFVHDIAKRFNRIKKCEDNIEDIYDSDVYRSLVDNDGPLSKKYPFNISFTLNTDGVPVFKSSKMSIWPLYMMINELPFKMRKQRENMILCGLWFGDTKPFMHSFTEPLLKSLHILEAGIPVLVNDKIETSRAYLISLTADLPAKCAILNTVQFNGQYSCFRCTQKGKTFKSAKGGNIHVFPYDENNPTGPERTNEMCVANGHEAYSKAKVINGIKGPSFFMAVNSFDFVKSVSVDYMHCVLQGITKLMVSLWFGSAHSEESFSLYAHVDVVDERLSKIKPPSTISRMPRSISQHFKYWKASELRAWLFFYSVPVLIDIMSTMHLYHYSSFVEAIYLLSSDSISTDDLHKSHKLLCFFVHMFESLYGERYYTLNLHSLLHLADSVRHIGPLWSNSCFPFENANGELLKLFHGTQYIDLQIVGAINVYQTLPLLTSEIETDSQVYAFVCKMRNHDPKKINRTNCYRFLGKGRDRNITAEEHHSITGYLGHQINVITFYSRISLRGQVYHSTDYSRVQVRNSYTVMYLDETGNTNYGHVCWYAKHLDVNKEDVICCVKKLNCAKLQHFGQSADQSTIDNFLGLSLNHIHVLEGGNASNLVQVIPIENILSLCVCIENDTNVFVCDEPNKHEINL